MLCVNFREIAKLCSKAVAPFLPAVYKGSSFSVLSLGSQPFWWV